MAKEMVHEVVLSVSGESLASFRTKITDPRPRGSCVRSEVLKLVSRQEFLVPYSTECLLTLVGASSGAQLSGRSWYSQGHCTRV